MQRPWKRPSKRPSSRRRQRSWLLLALLGGLVFASSVSASADAAARKRRQRPGSSSSNNNSGSSNGGQVTQPAKPQRNASAGASQSGNGGGSLDDQINAVRARIRVHRRATSQAVDRANLSGTKIYIPGGNAAGVSVSFTSKHAGKTVRGKVKATGSGEKAPATITATRAK